MQNFFVPIIIPDDTNLAQFIPEMTQGQAALFPAVRVRTAINAASKVNAIEKAKRVKVVASGIPGFFCVLRY